MTEIRVLVVEDDPRNADLHRRFAAKVPGFSVVGMASDYAEAVEQAEVLEPDLILLDLYLPQGNGLELLQQLRADGSQVDVILITAAREADTLQNALRGGVFDYIIKPVVFARFEESLQKYAAFRLRLTGETALEQADVDHLLHGRAAGPSTPQGDVPKGIDPLTLEKIQAVFPKDQPAALSAEAVGTQLGVSRSTARRYLEYLVSAGFLEADVQYGTVGRPERKYQRCR